MPHEVCMLVVDWVVRLLFQIADEIMHWARYLVWHQNTLLLMWMDGVPQATISTLWVKPFTHNAGKMAVNLSIWWTLFVFSKICTLLWMFVSRSFMQCVLCAYAACRSRKDEIIFAFAVYKYAIYIYIYIIFVNRKSKCNCICIAYPFKINPHITKLQDLFWILWYILLRRLIHLYKLSLTANGGLDSLG